MVVRIPILSGKVWTEEVFRISNAVGHSLVSWPSAHILVDRPSISLDSSSEEMLTVCRCFRTYWILLRPGTSEPGYIRSASSRRGYFKLPPVAQQTGMYMHRLEATVLLSSTWVF